MDLDSYKYVELQRLAKEVGLKANMKADKLLKALKQHFAHQQQTSENGNDAANVDEPVDAPGSQTAVFVTERRGKGRTGKRKLSDSTPVTAQNEEKPVDTEKNRRGSKRRKVSSAKDTSVPPETTLEKAVKTEETNSDAAIQPSGKGAGRRTAGKIPRHEGLMKKKSALRPTTPNFKKLHEAHFKKMESIDSYVQRKNKQMEVLRSSVKELKTLSEKTLMKSVETKKPSVSRTSLFSPGVQEKKPVPERRRLTQLSASKPSLKDSTTFKPTVLTTNKINVRFSQATQDNEYKRSLVKTPARRSPSVPLTSTPGRKSDAHNKTELNKSIGTINKTPGVTFVFSGDNSMSVTPGTNKKSKFDLKASLSRPLTYKPHKGKLKPFAAAAQENTALNKSQTVPSHQKNYKQHQVQTREERRVKQNEDRKQKKEMMLGARRGLVMA